MPEHEGANVALFIDWDNLAISTAADHSGAPPDLRRIVQVAQSYGTILLARAYAEWGLTSDRLNVYRAGVEPVYAPTFRFEADQPGQPSRGKSLADPCLVADCVDALHLFPHLTHLVIVSGDKDLIPIVRLAQLRGKRVIVVGPDLVAAVLKDMADEYVPYRSLLAGGTVADARAAAIRAEVAELGRRRRRRRGRSGPGDAEAPAEDATPAPEASPSEPPAPRGGRRERRPFVDRAGIFRGPAEPAPGEPEVAAEPEAQGEPPPPPAPRRRTRPEPVPREEEAAPPRDVAPTDRTPTRASVPPRERPPQRPPEPAPARAPEPAAAQADPREVFDTVTAILKERTSAGRPRLRATNLKDYLLARIPGFNERRYGFATFRDLVDAAERAQILTTTDVGNVQWVESPGQGTTTPPAAPAPAPAPAPVQPAAAPPVDPAEAVGLLVELRHRGRLLTQAYLLSSLASLVNARAPGVDADAEARRLADHLAEQGAIRIDREPQEVELNGARHRVRLCHLVEDSALVGAAEREWREKNPPATPAADATGTVEATPAADTRRRGRGRSSGRSRPEVEQSADAESPDRDADTTRSDGSNRRRRGQGGSASGRAPAVNGVREAQVFEALVAAVRESMAPGRDTAGAAGVKTRLTKALGDFDEGEFGYSKFKDFLLAAEKAGKVRVETTGAATRVGLPTST